MKFDLSLCEITELYCIFSALKFFDLPFISKSQVSYFIDKFDTFLEMYDLSD